MMAHTSYTCTDITDDLIPHNGVIVFDWDNTLKLYNHSSRQISSRVDKSVLQRWKSEKHCQMYVISAIYPSRINLETLLFEVAKLGLTEIFIAEEDKVEVKAGKYARKGNIIICGYDKAETFLKVTQGTISEQLTYMIPDQHAMDVADAAGDIQYDLSETSPVFANENVVFFDDEEVNIINFSALVQNSKCFLVK